MHMLGEQRDLMQVDYKFLQNLGDDMQELVAQLLRQRRSDSHLEDLNAVQTMAVNLSEAAMNEQVEALMYANNIQATCQKCHNSAQPRSGYSWDDIYKVNWSMILQECNTPSGTRNPYVCKNMFGMLSAVDYFYSANQLQHFSYPTIVSVAGELKRIATDLKTRNMTHGEDSIGLFTELIERSEKIIAFAELEDSRVVGELNMITSTCFTCHSLADDDPEDDGSLNFSPFQ
ncbi:MAG: hypothetical protein R2827_06085 [Bdellovibrionales bacterium]